MNTPAPLPSHNQPSRTSLARFVLALYPPSWRDRYGAELVGMNADTIDLRVATRPKTRDVRFPSST